MSRDSLWRLSLAGSCHLGSCLRLQQDIPGYIHVVSPWYWTPKMAQSHVGSWSRLWNRSSVGAVAQSSTPYGLIFSQLGSRREYPRDPAGSCLSSYDLDTHRLIQEVSSLNCGIVNSEIYKEDWQAGISGTSWFNHLEAELFSSTILFFFFQWVDEAYPIIEGHLLGLWSAKYKWSPHLQHTFKATLWFKLFLMK